MYSLGDYGEMIADAVRMGPYTRAIEAAVKPGSVVVDLGCGPGYFALLACRAGAHKVFAIDLADIAQFGRHFASANNFTGRIEFLQGDSRQIQLPERADLIVSDIRGALPFYGHSVGTIEDARQKFLAEEGVLIPEQDTLYAAVVEAEELYNRITAPWRGRMNGLDLSPALPYMLNEVHSAHFTAEQLVTEARPWCTIDYTKNLSHRVAATLEFQAKREGLAHGIAVWFDTQLFKNIGFSCAPGCPKTVYGHSYFPWLEPVAISAGQEIRVELHADLVGADYVWRWETQIFEAGKGMATRFQQSTLQGARFTPELLRRHAADFVPVLSEAGKAERWLLQAMDGNAPLQEIAQAAAQRFPQVFPNREEAFRRVSELSERFCR